MNRETWLNDLANKMAPRFEELGKPIPPFRVSIGFTSGGRGSNANGECWHANKSADRRFEILITPDNGDAMQVAAILAHELCHAAAGFKHKHKGDFATLMTALGMARPFTQSKAGDGFKQFVQPYLDELGPIPHAPLMFRMNGSAQAEGANDNNGQDEEDGSSNAKKKQSTRMLKACCRARVQGDDGEFHDCGYTVRLTKKWAKELGAACPAHGSMDVEGLEDEPDDEDADEAA